MLASSSRAGQPAQPLIASILPHQLDVLAPQPLFVNSAFVALYVGITSPIAL